MNTRALLSCCMLAALLAAAPLPVMAQQQAPSAAQLIEGAERLGTGPIAAYLKNGSVILAVPRAMLGKPFIWYAEVVGLPAGVVSDSLEAASLLARFERHGNLIVVRDLTTRASRTAGTGDEPPPEETAPDAARIPGAPEPDASPERPIDIALNLIETGPAMAAFPIAGELPDGTALIDVTATFSNDIASASARSFVALTGALPAAVDPSRSYVERVKASPVSLTIRSHLTFLAASPQNPVAGMKPVSVVIGHSFRFLPDKPMTWREADPRIGYFSTKFTEYESRTGKLAASRNVITRFRLEKKNPDAAVSDPVEPIVFLIGPGVPDRWRPYLKAGVELWQPAFAAAGFSNAIIARDAPGPQQDPDFSVEDIGHNMIRWVATERVNAYGPHVIDPRSGEILSAHILIWPSVLDYFSKYYFALFGTVDPEAAKLPLSSDKMGRLLTYIVAHEVGHAIGLRHNHIASTAFGVAQMRDPAFANVHGPNSSIMAYGRFNQVAQPGDGVTKLYPGLGPYDLAAIAWGYGVFDERQLAERAAAFAKDRALNWAAGEFPAEIRDHIHDPRVQRENTGAERIDATRLGVANVLRSLAHLPDATGGDDDLYASTLAVLLNTQKGLLESVSTLVGGALPMIGGAADRSIALIPADEQSAAVSYLLVEGVRSLEPYAAPAVLDRVAVVGGERRMTELQESLLTGLLTGPRLAVLESQSRRGPEAYSPSRFGHDVAEAVWGNLEQATPTDRVLQRAYVATTRQLIASWANAAATEKADVQAAVAAGYAPDFAAIESDTGDDTAYPAWLRAYLPQLAARLTLAERQAVSESDRLHFGEMSNEIRRLEAQLQ